MVDRYTHPSLTLLSIHSPTHVIKMNKNNFRSGYTNWTYNKSTFYVLVFQLDTQWRKLGDKQVMWIKAKWLFVHRFVFRLFGTLFEDPIEQAYNIQCCRVKVLIYRGQMRKIKIKCARMIFLFLSCIFSQ